MMGTHLFPLSIPLSPFSFSPTSVLPGLLCLLLRPTRSYKNLDGWTKDSTWNFHVWNGKVIGLLHPPHLRTAHPNPCNPTLCMCFRQFHNPKPLRSCTAHGCLIPHMLEVLGHKRVRSLIPLTRSAYSLCLLAPHVRSTRSLGCVPFTCFARRCVVQADRRQDRLTRWVAGRGRDATGDERRELPDGPRVVDTG